jgi:hypothetical protein
MPTPPVTSDRILATIDTWPKDSDGWVDWEPSRLAQAIPDKTKENLSVTTMGLIQKGKLEAIREGRFIRRVRLSPQNTVETIKEVAKSHTEQILHYLYGLADEKGVIRGDAATAEHLQAVFGRDFHDTNKALHNLNKLGILEIKEKRTGLNQVHRITKMRLRVERKSSWPIDLVTDEELPGKTDIETEDDTMQEGEQTPTVEEIRQEEVVGLGEQEMEQLASQTSEPETVDIPIEFTTPDPAVAKLLDGAVLESVSNTIEDFEAQFPLIAARVEIYRKRLRALKALEQAEETELAQLLHEKMTDPLDRELLQLMTVAGYYG